MYRQSRNRMLCAVRKNHTTISDKTDQFSSSKESVTAINMALNLGSISCIMSLFLGVPRSLHFPKDDTNNTHFRSNLYFVELQNVRLGRSWGVPAL